MKEVVLFDGEFLKVVFDGDMKYHVILKHQFQASGPDIETAGSKMVFMLHTAAEAIIETLHEVLAAQAAISEGGTEPNA